MKVYVCGASAEPERVRRAMDAVLAEGWALTHDWLSEIERVGTANDGLTEGQRFDSAARDLEAIHAADVVWVLAPEDTSTGAWIEFGYTLGRSSGGGPGGGPGLIVSGAASKRSIFCALVYEHDSDDEALDRLRGVADLLRRHAPRDAR